MAGDACNTNFAPEAIDPKTASPTEIARHLYADLYPSVPACGKAEFKGTEDAVNLFSHLPKAQAEQVNEAYKAVGGDSFLMNVMAEPRLTYSEKNQVAGALGQTVDSVLKSLPPDTHSGQPNAGPEHQRSPEDGQQDNGRKNLPPAQGDPPHTIKA